MMSSPKLWMFLALAMINGKTCLALSEDNHRIQDLPIITQEKSPIKFLTLVSNVKIGPGEYGFSKQEAQQKAMSFLENIKASNSRTNTVAVSAGVAIGPASFEASASTEWTKSNSKETEKTKKEASSFASSEHSLVMLEKNQFLMKAAEMLMSVFKNKMGVLSYIIIPTTFMYEGVYTVERLSQKHLILDSTFHTINTMTKANLSTYTHEQIRDAMLLKHLELNITSVYVNPNKYYQIRNFNFPTTYLSHSGNQEVNCIQNANGDKTLWKFEADFREKGKYYIKSKIGNKRLFNKEADKPKECQCHTTCWSGKNGPYCYMGNCKQKWPKITQSYHRKDYYTYDLCKDVAPGIAKQWWGVTLQRKNEYQLWTLDQLEGGQVGISNAETGDTLAQWSNTNNLNCGPLEFYCKNKVVYNGEPEACKQLDNSDNMWTLIPQN